MSDIAIHNGSDGPPPGVEAEQNAHRRERRRGPELSRQLDHQRGHEQYEFGVPRVRVVVGEEREGAAHPQQETDGERTDGDEAGRPRQTGHGRDRLHRLHYSTATTRPGPPEGGPPADRSADADGHALARESTI
ncbi:hypothetical protein ACFOJ6_03115 [Gordonia humi]|uniref:hypothetical protein n=1 Tax=Gordonia humi TaxID=686429 RepID=UPI003609F5D2